MSKFKNVLITGGAGFVGPYLYNELKKNGFNPILSKLEREIGDPNLEYVTLDVLDQANVESVIKKYEIDSIIHLAAISNVQFAWAHPTTTFNINVNGTINILKSIINTNPNIRLMLISSGDIYGKRDNPDKIIEEEDICHPTNIYGLSKLTMENVAKLYAQNYGLDILYIRAFNHIGPNQNIGFVVPDFAKQIVEIERGNQEPIIKVGNLKSARDFSDVRDIVRAYTLLLEKGKSGKTYNVASGKTLQIEKILGVLLVKSGKYIDIQIDENKLRKGDESTSSVSIKKLVEDTSYEPSISIEDTLEDVLKYTRENR